MSVVTALASYQCGPGSILAPVPYMGSVYLGFSPCSEGFSPGCPVFLHPQGTTSPNSNSTRIEDPHKVRLKRLSLKTQ